MVDVMAIARRIRSVTRPFGVELRRFPGAHPLFPVGKLLDHAGVDQVVDVGANVGQYAKGMRRVGYRGEILSFEPLRDAYEQLCAAAKRDMRWRCECAAVGDHAGDGQIRRAGNSVSSSLARMLPRHLASAPESAEVGVEQVRIVTLDDIVDRYGLVPEKTFVKVDTQGFERQVIAGGTRAMGHLAGVQLELALVPLYEGDLSLMDGVSLMADHGLDLVRMIPGFSDAETGEMLQADAVFLRR